MKKKTKIDLIGFHGQTMFHDGDNKISLQIGDGRLLSQITKKKVIYDFRQNDLKNKALTIPLSLIFSKKGFKVNIWSNYLLNPITNKAKKKTLTFSAEPG